jgi:hypothetical protein
LQFTDQVNNLDIKVSQSLQAVQSATGVVQTLNDNAANIELKLDVLAEVAGVTEDTTNNYVIKKRVIDDLNAVAEVLPAPFVSPLGRGVFARQMTVPANLAYMNVRVEEAPPNMGEPFGINTLFFTDVPVLSLLHPVIFDPDILFDINSGNTDNPYYCSLAFLTSSDFGSWDHHRVNLTRGLNSGATVFTSASPAGADAQGVIEELFQSSGNPDVSIIISVHVYGTIAQSPEVPVQILLGVDTSLMPVDDIVLAGMVGTMVDLFVTTETIPGDVANYLSQHGKKLFNACRDLAYWAQSRIVS